MTKIKLLWDKFKCYWSYTFPLYDYLKCRKYIKRPSLLFIKFNNLDNNWFFGLPANRIYYYPIISIECSNVGWKDKYDEPRWEYNPYLVVVLFRKWMFGWQIGWKDYINNLTTWELILRHNYYNQDIYEMVKKLCWLKADGSEQCATTLKKH